MKYNILGMKPELVLTSAQKRTRFQKHLKKLANTKTTNNSKVRDKKEGSFDYVVNIADEQCYKRYPEPLKDLATLANTTNCRKNKSCSYQSINKFATVQQNGKQRQG